jgi:hypothetical protein
MSLGKVAGSSYYKQTQLIQFDRAALKSAKRAMAGERDGRISKKEAPRVAAHLNDNGQLTDVEKKTLAKIRKDANLTGAGRAQLKHEMLSAAASRREAHKREARNID